VSVFLNTFMRIKRSQLGTALAAIFLLAAFSLWAGDSRPATAGSMNRYVSPTGSDRNDGSLAHPWATLNRAAQSAFPGLTIHVAPGVYNEAVVTKQSGAPPARIRFVSETKWGAIVRGHASVTWTNQGDYVDIVGFDISGDGRGGILNWGSGVRIVANHVHDIPASNCSGDGGFGIANANYEGYDNDIVANVVHNIGDLTRLCARVHGIYHSNLRGHLDNNISYRNQGFGIHLWHAATDVTIANNLVFSNHYGGILIGAGDSPHNGDAAFPADHITVANNIVVHNLNRYGIEEMGVTGNSNRYLNNLVYQNQNANWRLRTGRQSGTIEADPQFVNFQPDGRGDYHPRVSSPALRAGFCASGPASDIDGKPRPQNTACDIGPYESGPAVTNPWPPD